MKTAPPETKIKNQSNIKILKSLLEIYDHFFCNYISAKASPTAFQKKTFIDSLVKYNEILFTVIDFSATTDRFDLPLQQLNLQLIAITYGITVDLSKFEVIDKIVQTLTCFLKSLAEKSKQAYPSELMVKSFVLLKNLITFFSAQPIAIITSAEIFQVLTPKLITIYNSYAAGYGLPHFNNEIFLSTQKTDKSLKFEKIAILFCPFWFFNSKLSANDLEHKVERNKQRETVLKEERRTAINEKLLELNLTKTSTSSSSETRIKTIDEDELTFKKLLHAFTSSEIEFQRKSFAKSYAGFMNLVRELDKTYERRINSIYYFPAKLLTLVCYIRFSQVLEIEIIETKNSQRQGKLIDDYKEIIEFVNLLNEECNTSDLKDKHHESYSEPLIYSKAILRELIGWTKIWICLSIERVDLYKVLSISLKPADSKNESSSLDSSPIQAIEADPGSLEIEQNVPDQKEEFDPIKFITSTYGTLTWCELDAYSRLYPNDNRHITLAALRDKNAESSMTAMMLEQHLNNLFLAIQILTPNKELSTERKTLGATSNPLVYYAAIFQLVFFLKFYSKISVDRIEKIILHLDCLWQQLLENKLLNKGLFCLLMRLLNPSSNNWDASATEIIGKFFDKFNLLLKQPENFNEHNFSTYSDGLNIDPFPYLEPEISSELKNTCQSQLQILKESLKEAKRNNKNESTEQTKIFFRRTQNDQIVPIIYKEEMFNQLKCDLEIIEIHMRLRNWQAAITLLNSKEELITNLMHLALANPRIDNPHIPFKNFFLENIKHKSLYLTISLRLTFCHQEQWCENFQKNEPDDKLKILMAIITKEMAIINKLLIVYSSFITEGLTIKTTPSSIEKKHLLELNDWLSNIGMYWLCRVQQFNEKTETWLLREKQLTQHNHDKPMGVDPKDKSNDQSSLPVKKLSKNQRRRLNQKQQKEKYNAEKKIDHDKKINQRTASLSLSKNNHQSELKTKPKKKKENSTNSLPTVANNTFNSQPHTAENETKTLKKLKINQVPASTKNSRKQPTASTSSVKTDSSIQPPKTSNPVPASAITVVLKGDLSRKGQLSNQKVPINVVKNSLNNQKKSTKTGGKVQKKENSKENSIVAKIPDKNKSVPSKTKKNSSDKDLSKNTHSSSTPMTTTLKSPQPKPLHLLGSNTNLPASTARKSWKQSKGQYRKKSDNSTKHLSNSASELKIETTIEILKTPEPIPPKTPNIASEHPTTVTPPILLTTDHPSFDIAPSTQSLSSLGLKTDSCVEFNPDIFNSSQSSEDDRTTSFASSSLNSPKSYETKSSTFSDEKETSTDAIEKLAQIQTSGKWVEVEEFEIRAEDVILLQTIAESIKPLYFFSQQQQLSSPYGKGGVARGLIRKYCDEKIRFAPRDSDFEMAIPTDGASEMALHYFLIQVLNAMPGKRKGLFTLLSEINTDIELTLPGKHSLADFLVNSLRVSFIFDEIGNFTDIKIFFNTAYFPDAGTLIQHFKDGYLVTPIDPMLHFQGEGYIRLFRAVRLYISEGWKLDKIYDAMKKQGHLLDYSKYPESAAYKLQSCINNQLEMLNKLSLSEVMTTVDLYQKLGWLPYLFPRLENITDQIVSKTLVDYSINFNLLYQLGYTGCWINKSSNERPSLIIVNTDLFSSDLHYVLQSYIIARDYKLLLPQDFLTWAHQCPKNYVPKDKGGKQRWQLLETGLTKILLNGKAWRNLKELNRYKIIAKLFPNVAAYLTTGSSYQHYLEDRLNATDGLEPAKRCFKSIWGYLLIGEILASSLNLEELNQALSLGLTSTKKLIGDLTAATSEEYRYLFSRMRKIDFAQMVSAALTLKTKCQATSNLLIDNLPINQFPNPKSASPYPYPASQPIPVQMPFNSSPMMLRPNIYSRIETGPLFGENKRLPHPASIPQTCQVPSSRQQQSRAQVRRPYGSFQFAGPPRSGNKVFKQTLQDLTRPEPSPGPRLFPSET